jgi:hypothetical protein
MKKKNDKSMIGRAYTIGAITLAVIALITIIAVTVSIFAPRERTTEAKNYDLNCVTELRKDPLNECRKEK